MLLLSRLSTFVIVFIFIRSIHSAGNDTDDCTDCVELLCTKGKFQCNNGKCIPEIRRCDGVADCADSSDETELICPYIVCEAEKFRCKYGACINNSVVCDGKKNCVDDSDEDIQLCIDRIGAQYPLPYPVPPAQYPQPYPVPTFPAKTTTFRPTYPPATEPPSGCIIPDPPKFGTYIGLPPFENLRAGDVASMNSVIVYTCDDNFSLDSMLSRDFLLCFNKDWGKPPPVCLSTCNPVPESIEGKCEYKKQEVNCKSRLVEGSRAVFSCKDHYESESYGPTTVSMCQNGTWDREFHKCTAQCGRPVELESTFIVRGTRATHGKFPWHVAVYRREDFTAPDEFICGGSLISTSVVLSAAHCFTNNNGGEVLNKYLFTIGAGKYYRDLYDPRELFPPQISCVKHIEVGPNYKGILTNYRDDIAVVFLVKPVELSPVVQPVCLDWSNLLQEDHLTENNFGELVGWGLTDEQGSSSITLQYLKLPYVTNEKCFQTQNVKFYVFITADKFCAGYKNGSSACLGDSGGGLVFRNPSTGRYYIRGIVSSGPKKGLGCDSHKYTLFTNITNYLPWMNEVMSKYK